MRGLVSIAIVICFIYIVGICINMTIRLSKT